MALEAEVQIATDEPGVPDKSSLRQWVRQAFPELHGSILVRLVDSPESAALNERYRHKSGPTNILSFPLDLPPGVPNEQLGDLIICAPVVARQAREQGKTLENHYRHLLVHGVLHLQGHDHQSDAEAQAMEAREIEILDRLGVPNPY